MLIIVGEIRDNLQGEGTVNSFAYFALILPITDSPFFEMIAQIGYVVYHRTREIG